MAGQLDRAISESRQVARGLFPIRLQRDGLRPALEELARSVTQRFGIRCSFRTRGPIKGVDPALGTHFYRIAQEAASNAVRHGHPARISILLRGRAGGVELVVTDDGIGLPARSRHKEAGMGLHIMHYRARSIGGTLTIQPARPRGTVVSCRAPLAAPPLGG
jgi:signal transduction histidine kinase